MANNFIPFHKTVDDFNNTGQLPLLLRISNEETNASETRMRQHFDDITAVTDVLGDSPETTGLYLRRALDYYHVRDFDACIADLDRAVVLQPLVAISYFLRAQAICAQQLASAATTQTTSLPLSPATEAKIAYGKALEDLEQVLRLAPDMVYAHYNIGNIYVQMHEYDKAIKAYSHALALDPRFPDAYYNRGVVRLLDGHTDEGLSDLSQAGEYGLYSAYNLIKRYSKVK